MDGSLFAIQSFLVVIDDLDVEGVTVPPNETDPKLIIDPNAVLPHSIALEPL